MTITTKSPVRVAQEALKIGKLSLPAYGNKHSPKTFTQAQLFAILAVRAFFKTDFRGVIAILKDSAELRKALGLKKLPHYSTLCKAAKRIEERGATTGFSTAA